MRKFLSLLTLVVMSVACQKENAADKGEWDLPDGFEAVDLGLSVKWGNYNLGANHPEDYGARFKWGESTPYYDIQSWDDLNVCCSDPICKYLSKGENDQWLIAKYNNLSTYGEVDGRTVLAQEDDAASVLLGIKWRIPTKSEWDELIEHCDWAHVYWKGAYGWKVSSKIDGYTDKWIFLPLLLDCRTGLQKDAKQDYYWSSNHYSGVNALCFEPSSYGVDVKDYEIVERFVPCLIRPVLGGERTRVNGIRMDREKISLNLWESTTLIATILPSNAMEKGVAWSSSNSSVVIVKNGFIQAVGAGVAVITVKSADGDYRATCEVIVTAPTVNPQMIDLGLSVKWASFNLGASSPEGYGAYYDWGETEPKSPSDYDHITYKWGQVPSSLTKYNTMSSYGTVDNKTQLDSEDDAATLIWGRNWRIPTKSEWEELLNNCKWERTTLNGKDGYKVVGKKAEYLDSWLFLPVAGALVSSDFLDVGSIGYYWSSSLYTDSPWWAYSAHVDLESSVHIAGYLRFVGGSIRPVSDKI